MEGRELPLYSFLTIAGEGIREIGFSVDKESVAVQKRLYGKNWIYKNTKENDIPNLKGKNVVVLFTEGFSLNIIDKFNQWDRLTPNILRFLDNNLWFDNYFNHTASTYRGIRGQMSSSYQLRGVDIYHFKDSSVISKDVGSSLINITKILRDNGYHSYFLCAHTSTDNMIKYLQTFGFDKVYSASDFRKDGGNLSDKELFSGLEKIMTSGELKEPYFIGTYNFGTHFGEVSPR